MWKLIEKLGEKVINYLSYVYSLFAYILFPLALLCELFIPDKTEAFREFVKTYTPYVLVICFFGLPWLLMLVAFIFFLIEEWKKEAKQSNKLTATILLILTVILFAAVTYFGGNADVPYVDTPYAHPYKR